MPRAIAIITHCIVTKESIKGLTFAFCPVFTIEMKEIALKCKYFKYVYVVSNLALIFFRLGFRYFVNFILMPSFMLARRMCVFSSKKRARNEILVVI